MWVRVGGVGLGSWGGGLLCAGGRPGELPESTEWGGELPGERGRVVEQGGGSSPAW